jgi:hypothetical protein
MKATTMGRLFSRLQRSLNGWKIHNHLPMEETKAKDIGAIDKNCDILCLPFHGPDR